MRTFKIVQDQSFCKDLDVRDAKESQKITNARNHVGLDDEVFEWEQYPYVNNSKVTKTIQWPPRFTAFAQCKLNGTKQLIR